MRRRIAIGLAIYIATTAVFALVAGPQRLSQHTAFNHYAHLADAWLHGRNDIVHGGPPYAQGNDFAEYKGKTYISFPPFPAVLVLPFVKMAGSPENFRDGQFFVWMAGLGPALLFLVLEKLRRTERSPRSERENIGLCLLFAFGTVYFFTAVEGTVWFAAHVVGAALVALYLLMALDARHPFWAGLVLGCSFATRPLTLLTGVVFLAEAVRVSCASGFPDGETFLQRVKATWGVVDRGALARKIALFGAPIAFVLVVSALYNHARFDEWSPSAYGHEHLTVAWQRRITQWGLFGYHYLPKNLGVWLTILPFLPPKGTMCLHGSGGLADALLHFADCVPFRVNEHGLALWFTSPFYFWCLRPKTRSYLYDLVAVAAILPMGMLLFYQNSGWRQFGYRFSNDYAIFLFVLLAVGARPFGKAFKTVAAWAIAWNLFGAVTFDRAEYDRFYFREGTQRELYQAD